MIPFKHVNIVLFHSPESVEKSTDPNFIGAWWLGYMISGVGLAIFAAPLWFYPKRMTPHKAKMGSLMPESKPVEGQESEEVHEKQGLIEQAKGLIWIDRHNADN